MYGCNYDIYNDYYFDDYIERKDLSEETVKNYAKQLTKFCSAVGLTLEDIIDRCKAQQEVETEEVISSTNEEGNQVTRRRITRFDVNGRDSLVKRYFNEFETYCRERGNKNTTINSGIDSIRAVLASYGVSLPDRKSYENDVEDFNVLSKEDFKFILADSSLMHKGLICFMLSTGFRVSDCLDITIGEFMEATADFHDFVEVDDFIDNAPDDMRAYFDFKPKKTKKRNVRCKTYCSEEACNFIIQNLRRVKNEYFPRKSKKIHKELKFSKSDFIFGSKRSYYKKPPQTVSISDMYGVKNKKLYEWHINKIQQDIKNGIISSEDYDKKVAEIPRFHPHACRKYFCTIIQRHCANERTYRMMEGHAPANKIDPSYINISKEDIKKVYDEAIGDLSIYYSDDKELEQIRKDFNQQLEEERRIHEEERQRLRADYEEEISQLKNENSNLSRQVTAIDNRVNGLTRANELRNIMEYARNDNLVNEHDLMSHVYDIYQEMVDEDENFHPSRTNMDDIIVQAYNRSRNQNRRQSRMLLQSTTDEFDEICNYILLKSKEIIDTREFMLSPNLNDELMRKIEEYALEIDNAVDSNNDWQHLIDDRRISHIVAQITKSIR